MAANNRTRTSDSSTKATSFVRRLRSCCCPRRLSSRFSDLRASESGELTQALVENKATGPASTATQPSDRLEGGEVIVVGVNGEQHGQESSSLSMTTATTTTTIVAANNSGTCSNDEVIIISSSNAQNNSDIKQKVSVTSQESKTYSTKSTQANMTTESIDVNGVESSLIPNGIKTMESDTTSIIDVKSDGLSSPKAVRKISNGLADDTVACSEHGPSSRGDGVFEGSSERIEDNNGQNTPHKRLDSSTMTCGDLSATYSEVRTFLSIFYRLIISSIRFSIYPFISQSIQ